MKNTDRDIHTLISIYNTAKEGAVQWMNLYEVEYDDLMLLDAFFKYYKKLRDTITRDEADFLEEFFNEFKILYEERGQILYYLYQDGGNGYDARDSTLWFKIGE